MEWEYRIVTESGATSEKVMTHHFDLLGAQGWELVVFEQEEYRYRAVFKRPRPEGAPPIEELEPARERVEMY